MERKKLYNIMYRLKGDDADFGWYPCYRRGYCWDVIKRKYDKLVAHDSSLEFLIVYEP